MGVGSLFQIQHGTHSEILDMTRGYPSLLLILCIDCGGAAKIEKNVGSGATFLHQLSLRELRG